VDLIIDSIRNSSYAGVYNGTAPKPVTMAQLCSAVGGVMGRPSWLPVPDFAITTLLGEGAQVGCRSTLVDLSAVCASDLSAVYASMWLVKQLHCAG
jgi:NAD dependent epimerase/dehydratase family enzyme